MQQSGASQIAEPTPIFGAYRRGYDPDQVDRYVADQQRRLDDAQFRASEAERKLAAAVGQLRELHRRVGVLEQNQQRSSQPVRLEGVGEHIQRIFEEARDGAEAMRQSAEMELADVRQRTIDEARSIIAGARKKAGEIEVETDRRRREETERLDEDRSRVATQLTYLHEQRKNSVAELLRIREVIDSTIAEVSADLRPGTSTQKSRASDPQQTLARQDPRSGHPSMKTPAAKEEVDTLAARDLAEIDSLLASEALGIGEQLEHETARLVRAHRDRVATSSASRTTRHRVSAGSVSRPALAVFDYEDQ